MRNPLKPTSDIAALRQLSAYSFMVLAVMTKRAARPFLCFNGGEVVG